MLFRHEVKKGVFLKRYKRFFADIEIDGKVEVAHIPNTGSMLGCVEPHVECVVTFNDNPERKLKYTLELIKTPTSWVGVNTSHPNELVKELWAKNIVPHWKSFDRCQKEVKISQETRLDMVLWSSTAGHNVKAETKKSSATKSTQLAATNSATKKSEKSREQDLSLKLAAGSSNNDKLINLKPPLHFIEIKNVTLARENVALFPDAQTTRGQKHISELMSLMELGYTCELVFVVQRQDCSHFTIADHIDPEYGRRLREAIKKGLLVSAFPTRVTENCIELLPQPLSFLNL